MREPSGLLHTHDLLTDNVFINRAGAQFQRTWHQHARVFVIPEIQLLFQTLLALQPKGMLFTARRAAAGCLIARILGTLGIKSGPIISLFWHQITPI